MASTIWKGQLTFGLVSIPVKLVRAARAEKIHMHHLRRGTGERVRQVFVPGETGIGQNPAQQSSEEEAAAAFAVTAQGPVPVAAKRWAVPEEPRDQIKVSSHQPPVVPQTDLVRGFEFEKDRYVEFEKEELEQIAPKTSSDMQILKFVRFADVDAVYLESSYYVVADNGGAKPYALLYEALKKSGYAAIAEFVMHRRDQTMILRTGMSGIIGHTLFYDDEVRRADEYRADSGQINPKEMDLAMRLVDALAAPFQPEKFKDRYRERLQQVISEKVGTGAVRREETVERKAPVVDVMAALKESLMQAKKPPARESKPAALAKRSDGKASGKVSGAKAR